MTALLASSPASAIGFGQLLHQSALGDPLDIEFPVEAKLGELGDSAPVVSVADADIYHTMGYARAGILNRATVSLEPRGHLFLVHIRARDRMMEAHLPLIAQVRSPSGTAFYRYDIVLDPPVAPPGAGKAATGANGGLWHMATALAEVPAVATHTAGAVDGLLAPLGPALAVAPRSWAWTILSAILSSLLVAGAIWRRSRQAAPEREGTESKTPVRYPHLAEQRHQGRSLPLVPPVYCVEGIEVGDAGNLTEGFVSELAQTIGRKPQGLYLLRLLIDAYVETDDRESLRSLRQHLAEPAEPWPEASTAYVQDLIFRIDQALASAGTR